MEPSPLLLAFAGTFFTYVCTIIGSSSVLVFFSIPKKLMDFLSGFTGGVMISATCFGLIEESWKQSIEADWSKKVPYLPVSIGFIVGSAFMKIIQHSFSGSHHHHLLVYEVSPNQHENDKDDDDEAEMVNMKSFHLSQKLKQFFWGRKVEDDDRFRRSLLLVLAMILHKFPEGMALGMAIIDASVKQKHLMVTFNLALAIGLQNILEGISITMTLRREGLSPYRSFIIGQMTGLSEPVGGLIGVAAISVGRFLLPFFLAIAAGAIFFIVIEELIPESQSGHKHWATLGSLSGFLAIIILEKGDFF